MKARLDVHHAQLVISIQKVDPRDVKHVHWDILLLVPAIVPVHHVLLVICGQAQHHVKCVQRVNGNSILVAHSVSHVPMVPPPIWISQYHHHKQHVHHVSLVTPVPVVTVIHVPLVDMHSSKVNLHVHHVQLVHSYPKLVVHVVMNVFHVKLVPTVPSHHHHVYNVKLVLMVQQLVHHHVHHVLLVNTVTQLKPAHVPHVLPAKHQSPVHHQHPHARVVNKLLINNNIQINNTNKMAIFTIITIAMLSLIS